MVRAALTGVRLVAVAFVLAACGGERSPTEPEDIVACDSQTPAPASSPMLELFDDRELPLVDGNELKMYTGPQGGQHFYVAPRIYADAVQRWQIDVELRPPDQTLQASGFVSFRACELQWTDTRTITVFLETKAVPLSGQLRVEAKPEEGTSIVVEMPVTIVAELKPPSPPPPPAP